MRNQQCIGADSEWQALCGIQPSFPVQLFAWTLLCKVPEFSVTESYRVEWKLDSVRVKKKKATCFCKGIKSILLSNPVCSLLPWISCGCGCQRGKESWSVPGPNPKELNPLSWKPFHLLRVLWKSGGKSEITLKEISWWFVTSPEDTPVYSLPQRENTGAQSWAETF